MIRGPCVCPAAGQCEAPRNGRCSFFLLLPFPLLLFFLLPTFPTVKAFSRPGESPPRGRDSIPERLPFPAPLPAPTGTRKPREEPAAPGLTPEGGSSPPPVGQRPLRRGRGETQQSDFCGTLTGPVPQAGLGMGGPRKLSRRLLPASLFRHARLGPAPAAGGGGGGPEGRAPSPGRWARSCFDAGCSPLLQVLG